MPRHRDRCLKRHGFVTTTMSPDALSQWKTNRKNTPQAHRTFPSGSWWELSQVCVTCPAALLLVHQSYGSGFQCKNMPVSIIPQMVVFWYTMLSVTAFLGACEIIVKSLQSLELQKYWMHSPTAALPHSPVTSFGQGHWSWCIVEYISHVHSHNTTLAQQVPSPRQHQVTM